MNKKKKKSNKVALVIVLAILVLLLGCFAIGYRYYLNELKPVSNTDSQVAFVVEENQSMNKVIDNLYQQGLIRNDKIAKLYIKINRINDYYAGNFILNTNMSTKEVFATLSNVKNASRNQVQLTIIPGDWAKHVANKIAEVTNLQAQDIMDKWNDIEYIYSLIDKYDFLSEEVFNSEHCYLEGFLYPETYNIYENTTIEQVTERILDQTNVIYQKYAKDIANSGYSTFEVFNLASCILFEANTKEDMELVSSVFHNRFEKGMKMQSSVTVCYALYQYDNWIECEKNAGVVDSKYNTYLYPGLPIGPVCNPTEMAINAALHPAESDYLFFIANLQTGRCIFSETYQQHQQKVDSYLNY